MRFRVACMLLVIGAIVFRIGNICSVTSGQDKPQTDDIRQAQIEYLQTILKNSQSDLARDRQLNTQGVYSPNTVREERLCKFAEIALKSLTDQNSGTLEEGIAREVVASLQSELSKQVKINSIAPTTQSKAEVERIQCRVDLASARLKILEKMAHATVDQRLEWALMLQTERDCLTGFFDGYL